MQQKLKDLALLVKTDRRIWAAGAFIVIVFFLWMLTSSPGYRPPVKATTTARATDASPQGMGPEEAFRDLIQAFKNDIDRANKERADLAADVKRYNKEFSEHRQQVTGIFETFADKFEQLAHEVDAIAEAVSQKEETVAVAPAVAIEQPEEVERIGFVAEPPAPEAEAPATMRISVISPGDSVPVRLLTGVNAPVDGTPYPVVFELAGPVTGPDGSALDLGAARIVAAAQGSEADGRALFRLTNLAMRHKDGRRSVVDVDGWIVGEDGVRGMSGVLIDKLGRLIAATAGVSFAAALGTNIEAETAEVENNAGGVVLPSGTFQVATASALVDASNRLGQIMLNRYESLVPVVEILSGREVVAIFSKTTEVEVIDDGDYSYGVYATSLD